jgi:hypothetical protein
MRKPIEYFQTDERWAGLPYRVAGKEESTIGGSGCGPTCAAMVIETIKGKPLTPVTACEWSVDHGYKAIGHGTYHAFFSAIFTEYGIQHFQTIDMEKILAHLKAGGWAIGHMKRGNWTSGGHFILVYGFSGGYVYVNDPASKTPSRVKARWSLFKAECTKAWGIHVPKTLPGDAPKPAPSLTYFVHSPVDGYLNMRKGPGLAYGLIRRLPHGTKVTVVSQKNSWAKLKEGGHVHIKGLSKYEPVNTKYVTLYAMNIREGYSTKTKVKKVIPKGKEIHISKIRGDWGYAYKYRGWIRLRDSSGKAVHAYCRKL